MNLNFIQRQLKWFLGNVPQIFRHCMFLLKCLHSLSFDFQKLWPLKHNSFCLDKDPKRKTLAKELEDNENLLKRSIEKLKSAKASRAALVSQLKEALQEQVSDRLITFTCYLNVNYQPMHSLPLYGVFGQRESVIKLFLASFQSKVAGDFIDFIQQLLSMIEMPFSISVIF